MLAIFETRRFTFHAAGESEDHAYHTLEEAWLAHADQTGADRAYLLRDAVTFIDLAPGEATRDGHFLMRVWCQGSEDENGVAICPGRPVRNYRATPKHGGEAFEAAWCPECAALAEDEKTVEAL